MKIFYIFSPEDSETQIQSNWQSCRAIFPDALIEQGKPTILETYNYLSSLSPDELFVWVDGDNTVLPEAIKALSVTQPSIFMSRNPYDIVYGHGGIKVCKPGIYIRPGIIDVTWYLGLTPVQCVASIHNLGHGWIRYRAIFVEMLKNALKGEKFILAQWQDNCPEIWSEVEHVLNTQDINYITDIIRYRSRFQEHYENRMRSHLQK